ncbi:hypothetical protein Q3G72_032657 [Acer saccharum]|nr:hypothetical protein Q3G72_032657 [Acer saccharum]
MNSDFHESYAALFTQSWLPSQPTLSTSGDVVTSSGNSYCTVMAVPSGAKSSKVPDRNLGPQVSGALSYADLLKTPSVQVLY